MIFHHKMVWIGFIELMMLTIFLYLKFSSSPSPSLVRHSPHMREFHQEKILFEYWEAYQSLQSVRLAHDFPQMMNDLEILLERRRVHINKKTISNHGNLWTCTLSLQGTRFELLKCLEGIESLGGDLDISAMNLHRKEDQYVLFLVLQMPLLSSVNNGEERVFLYELNAAMEGRVKDKNEWSLHLYEKADPSVLQDLFATIPSIEPQNQSFPVPVETLSPQVLPQCVLLSPFIIIGTCSLNSEDGRVLIQNTQTNEIHCVVGRTVSKSLLAPHPQSIEFSFQNVLYALEWPP